jgi:DNA-binding CsgD family transcriptional regulator
MTATALKLAMQPLRVVVFAAEPERQASLSRLVRDLGHVVVDASEKPSAILTDGLNAEITGIPTVALGGGSDTHDAALPRDASPQQIDAALRAVAAGLSVTIAEERGRVFQAVPESDERTLLTPREVEVLSAVSNGMTNKEIARALGISRHTVKFHLESLMRKLDVSSRAEAVSKSMRLNLLAPYRI